jgi:hypothetical protein
VLCKVYHVQCHCPSGLGWMLRQEESDNMGGILADEVGGFVRLVETLIRCGSMYRRWAWERRCKQLH